MKVRNGFVSNSSTSSFLCDFCGENVATYESEGLEDIGMFECMKGHTLCDIHALDDFSESERYDADSRHCPICQMQFVKDGDLIMYLLQRAGLSRTAITEEIKARFSTYTEFVASLNPLAAA